MASMANFMLPYLTHGHYNKHTDRIEKCSSLTNEYCEQIDIGGKEEIWLFWRKEETVAQLFIENVHEKFQIDQRSPENNQWRKIDAGLAQSIQTEIGYESLLSIAMTNVRFTDLILGMQTLWFTFKENENTESVPTVIHCYRKHHQSVQCIWVF